MKSRLPPVFVEAVLYRYRAGIPWRDLPETVWRLEEHAKRLSRWAKKGAWMIDSTIVRAHQHRAGAPKKDDDQPIGRSKGGLSTKIQNPRSGRRARQLAALPADPRAGP